MALIIGILWFIKTLKSGLFWLYLMQLKEYKIKRLKDHFQTEKGQKLLYDTPTIAKTLILLSFPLTHDIFPYIILAAYSFETAYIAKMWLEKRIKRPVKTSSSTALMAIFALSIAMLGGLIYLFGNSLNNISFYLIVIDILTPIIVLAIVFILKPFNNLMRRKLFEKAKQKRRSLDGLLVIGIVGSYGKTSTKEYLYEILKDKFNIIKTSEHENTEIAIANLILNKLNKNHEIFICEMGAYEKGEIKMIAEIAMPKIGVFLGANEQHLSLFGTMEDLLKGEGGEELLSSLPKGSLGIFNGNNKYAYELYKKANIAKRITYSPTLLEIINPEKRDVRAENINVSKDSIRFRVVSNKNSKGVEVKADLLGAHNVENILLAVAVAEELGMSLQEISAEIKNIKPMEKTMNLSKSKNGINIVNSTYSSNPSAVRAHLDYLKAWENAKKIIVMPCLIELGDSSEKIHRQIGRQLAEVCDLAIITTADKLKEIEIGAKESGKSKTKILSMSSPEEIKKEIESFASKGDVILLEGRLPEEIIKSIEEI